MAEVHLRLNQVRHNLLVVLVGARLLLEAVFDLHLVVVVEEGLVPM